MANRKPTPQEALVRLEEADKALLPFQGKNLEQNSEYSQARKSFDKSLFDYVEVTKDTSHFLVHNRKLDARLAGDRKFFKKLSGVMMKGIGRDKRLLKERVEGEYVLAGLLIDYIEAYEAKRTVDGLRMFKNKKASEDIGRIKDEFSALCDIDIDLLPNSTVELWGQIYEEVDVNLLPEGVIKPSELKKWANYRPELKEMVDALEGLVED